MTSSDSKVEKIQKHFKTLSSVASSLNEASDELTAVVSILDEALKKLNVGLTAWVTFHSRPDNEDAGNYDEDQIGYCKVKGTWGIAFRHIWGNANWEVFHDEGPWLFNDAPRKMRLRGVDKIPDLIEALSKEAAETTKKVHEKTLKVAELASAVKKIASQKINDKGGK
jgi:hypothetical protein